MRRLSVPAAFFCLAMTACGNTTPTPTPAMAPTPATSATRHAPATWNDVQALPAASAGIRIAYGAGPRQFGDLRLPAGNGPHPVAILLHGGCWQAEYDLAYMAHLADRLAQAGIATWSLEYRGIGDVGGGWPGTFEDVDHAAAFLRTLARTHPLDLDRVTAVGHSAGGQLALYLAAQTRMPAKEATTAAPPVPLRGVVALAGIVDLREYAAGSGSCNQSVVPLLGGTPEQVPERYAATSPSERLPIGVPVKLVIGALDPIVAPASNERFAALARERGDTVELSVIEGAGHFDLVMPEGAAAMAVQRAIREVLGRDR